MSDKNRLTKAETVALWHAVNWTDHVLRNWRKDGFKDDADRGHYDVERQRLLLAKRALRKVNAIRKGGAQ